MEANPITIAADNYNLENGQRSWFQSTIDGTLAVAVGAVNGVSNSIGWTYNAISNTLSGESAPYIPEDTGMLLQSVGMEDTARFYAEHKAGVDVTADIVGGIVPGMYGIKALHWAGNSSKILGSLGMSTSKLEKARESARAAALASESTYNPLHGAALNAMAQGFALNAWEGLAFTTASLATTFQSPILREESNWDIAWNTLVWGGLAGGAIGGAVSAAVTHRGVSKALAQQASERANWAAPIEGETAANSIIRMIASGVPREHTTEQLIKLTGDDGGITLPLKAILTKASDDNAIYNLLGDLESAKRLSSDLNPDRGYQYIELATGHVYDDLEHVKALGNLADNVPKNAKIEIFRDRVNVRLPDGTFEREIFAFDGPITEMTVEEAQVSRILFPHTPKTNISSDDVIGLEGWLQGHNTNATIDGRVYSTGFSTLDDKALAGTRKEVEYLLIEAKNDAARQLGEAGVAPEIIDKLLNKSPSSEKLWEVAMADMEKVATQPQFAALEYKIDSFYSMEASTFAEQAVRYAESEAKLIREKNSLVAANLLMNKGHKTLATSLPSSEEFSARMNTVSKASTAAGRFSMTNPIYGSAMSIAAYVGQLLNKAYLTEKGATAMRLSSHISGLRTDLKFQDEWIMFNSSQRLRDAPYVQIGDELVRLDVAKAEKKMQIAIDSTIDSNKNPERIKMSPEVAALRREHNTINLQNYRKPASAIATEHGLWDVKVNERYPDFLPDYQPPVNVAKYPHFAFLRQDPEVFGAGSHTSVIVAKDAEALQKKIETAKQHLLETEGEVGLSRYQFITKKGSDEYHEALANYEYARGFNESRIDSALRKKGVFGEEFPLLESQKTGAFDDAIDDLQHWHDRMIKKTNRDIIELKYREPFAQLRQLGEKLEELETSRKGKQTKAALENLQNPFHDVIKTALDYTKMHEHPMWSKANEITEQVGTKALAAINNVVDTARDAFKERKLRSLDEFDSYADEINKTAERLGLKPSYGAAAQKVYGDQIAQSPLLGRFIARTQGILSGFILGIDPIQHLTSAWGLAVMQNAEMASILGAIAKKDASVVGDLAMVNLPGTQTGYSAPVKSLYRSIRAYFQGSNVWNADKGAWEFRTGKELLQEYEKKGVVSTELFQLRQILDDAAIMGNESAATLNQKMLSATDKFIEYGRTVTGGNWTEKFTRFVAAHAVRELTDHALAQGVLKTPEMAETFWNVAVNRIQGNMLASQRPVFMQGNIGQAIGLFMTYQVNMMQQLFRHIGDKDKVATGMLLGTQSTIFGMQGLPGWNFINTHLIGNAFGNESHTDAYATVNNLASKEVADWVLYGAASNALGVINPELKFNIYTRGDINPRELTIFPAAIDQTIIYKTTWGFVNNIINMGQNLANGAPASQAFYQALQHNGMSRPLAGLGAVLAGGQYTTDGKLMATVDEQSTQFHIAQVIRLLGAKPLDDALASDALFRTRAYDAYDKKRQKELAEAVRLTYADSGEVDPEQWDKFLQEYVKNGGNPAGFRNFMVRKLKDQSMTIVEQSAAKMREPMMKNYLSIIGADEQDFSWSQRQFP